MSETAARVRLPAAVAERSDAGRDPVKRFVDVLGSFGLLVVLSPVLAVIAAAVRLDSPGPALYKQERVGRGGRRFTMYKFRTMRADSDTAVHRDYVLRYMSGAGEELRNADGRYKLESDPRVTRTGRWLRRTSLDELPQLLNVAFGQMSLVGPRPPLPYEVERYTQRHARRLEALPGMTGLWQVSGRNRTTFEEMVDLDLAYIERWSPWLDLRILARTIGVVVTGEGG
jgi:lipopolysaccharide/colanic/teichoic acid biosynthesis glycosyltransferase